MDCDIFCARILASFKSSGSCNEGKVNNNKQALHFRD